MPASFPYNPPHEETEVLHIDDDLIIVNKPAGLLSVPGRGEDKQDCLISRLQQTNPEALIVHRLDMPTSGILVLARSTNIQKQLSKKFQQREISKQYIAVVKGIVENATGAIDLPLITDWPNRPKQKVDYEHGKPSLTHYTVLTVNAEEQTSRLLLTPITGRSHQLRVHLLSIGHIIKGDALYSNTEARKNIRLHLHASKIIFTHPVTNKPLSIQCECPF